MNYVDFFILAGDNLLLLILLCIVFIAIYLLIYRKYILSVFDPMFFIALSSGLANCIVFYLFFLKEIQDIYFYSFLVTEVAFLCGFFIFRPINSIDNSLKIELNKIEVCVFDKNFITILFYWASVLHIFSQLVTYMVVGLPILMESRLTTYSGGSGFGLFGRLLDISSGIGIFLMFYRIFYNKCIGLGRIYNYFYLLFVVFAMIVSGNKTNLLFLIYYLFMLNIFMLKISGNKIYKQITTIRKFQKILLFASFILVFLVITIQLTVNEGSAVDNPFLVLAQRIVSFGDIYYLTLPNDVILSLRDKQGPILQLFKDPLGMFRIIPWSQLPLDNGFAVSYYHYGDVPSGPNPRYNYFAMLYFDNIFSKALYCFVIGAFLSFLRNKLFYLLPRNIFFGVIYALFAINIIYAYQDMPTMILKCSSIFIFFTLILLLTYFTHKILNFDGHIR